MVVWGSLALVMLSLLVSGCARPPHESGESVLMDTGQKSGPKADSAEAFEVVDCLLPGLVRRLGTRVTYLTARRPLKTTAEDCAIRGGEYVAFDRADPREAFAAAQLSDTVLATQAG